MGEMRRTPRGADSSKSGATRKRSPQEPDVRFSDDGGMDDPEAGDDPEGGDDLDAGAPAYALLDEIDRERVSGSEPDAAPDGDDAVEVRTETGLGLHPVDGSQNPNEDIVGDDDGGDYRSGIIDPLSNDRAPNPGSTKLVKDPRDRD